MSRYIKSVTLKNFQSYKNQKVEFKPGLNLLLGTSDSGKSAILRAISFVLYNHPKKDTLIHWGETETEVTLEFSDGVKVTRIKGENRNAISAIDAKGNKISKEKIDKEIPDDIKTLLGNPPQDDFNGLISYADQFSPMFLVDLSPTDLPRSLSGLTGIEVLEESAKQLMTNYKALDKQNKVDEKEYSVLLNEAQAYSYVDSYEQKLNDLSTKLTEIAALEEKIVFLENIIKDFDFNINFDCIQSYENLIEIISESLDKIKKTQSILDKHNKLLVFNLLEHNDFEQESFSVLENFIDKISSKLENFEIYNKQLADYKKLEQINITANNIKEKGEKMSNEYKDLKNSLDEAESDYVEFKDFLVKEKIQCETCGSILQ